MHWNDWTPQENVIMSIRDVLQEALIPDNEIQRNVQQKLNVIQMIGDFSYYLLFILGDSKCSEEIRNLSGILLKNNISSIFNSIPPDQIQRIRHECLRLIKDPCRDIQLSISNVLVTLAKDNLGVWPELIPYLLSLIDTTCDYSEVVLGTLFKICEDLILKQNPDQANDILRKVFPKMNQLLSEEKCRIRVEIIKLVNQFLVDYYLVVRQTLDMDVYLKNVIKFEVCEEDNELQKYICQTFVIYLDNREDSLLPHLNKVILYLWDKTCHKDTEVALQACEFWLTCTKLPNCKEILSVHLEKLLPIVLENMKYSQYELEALKECLGNDADLRDLAQDTCRFQNRFKDFDRGDTDEEFDDDDVDDFCIGWTLRKCSAASLDGMSVKFGDELLQLLIPYLNEILIHNDVYVRESAILALGAIADGCLEGLKQYLPLLIEYLISSMSSEHSIVRVITCWTLSRYVGWIINSDPSPHVYFIPVMTVLLKHFVDSNKRVQRAAISAFCIFQEEAQLKLIPYIDFILEGFEQGFQKFHSRSLYLLYDAIGVLAQSVGSQLSRIDYVDKLMRNLMKNFAYYDYSDDNFIAVFECLACIIPALEISFLPYAEVVYWHCLQIISKTMHDGLKHQENPEENDLPDKEAMNVAHDVLYSMALGLKSHFIKFVTNSNLLVLLHSTMSDSMVMIRQTATALYGELIVLGYVSISANVSEYIPLIIKNFDERFDGVCNNAAWVVGRLSAAMGVTIQPYLSEILPSFLTILRRLVNSNRPMYQTLAVSFCTVCYVSNDITLNEAEIILKNCCMLIRNVRDSDEKDLAFRGLCKLVMRYPEFFDGNFMYFCDAVASWNDIRLDLKEEIRNILLAFKEQCGENNWLDFHRQCPEPLKVRLAGLYGV